MPSRADVEAGRAFVRLFLKNDMSRQLVRALKAAQTKLRNFGQSAMMAGRQIAMAGAALTAPFVFSIRTYANFDDAMREVAGVTQAAGDDFASLTAEAKRLGASTSYTASQVALLMAELGRAGFAPKQIETMTGSVLSLARATKTEGAEAAGIMAAAIRQFSLNAGDASRVADVLTAGANKSFNTLESLGESLKYAGPIANDFNMSLEDTVAVLGTLGNVGIQGSMAGATIRRIMLATGAEAEKLRGIFGVTFVDAAGNARPLIDTLDEIANATRNLGTAERAAKFQEAFGLRGITGASAIGKNIVGTRELRQAIAEAGGTAEKTAKMMDSGLGGAFRILMSAIEGVQIAIGEALAPTITKLAKFITAAAQSTIGWIKNNKALVIAIAVGAAGVTAFGVALMGLGLASVLVSAGLGLLAVIITAVTSPLGILTAIVVGGAVAWMRYSESGKRAWASLKAAVLPIVETLKATFGGIKDALESGDWGLAGKIAMAGLKLAVLQGLSAIQQAFPATFSTILRVFGKIGDGIVAAWNKVTGFLTTQWNAWGKQTLDTVMGVASRIPQIWQETVQGMANWMLEQSAKGGIMGKAMSKVLGVDMSQEQARATRLDRELGLGPTDVLADARKAVEDYTQSLVDNVAAIGGEAGTGKVSESLEAFLEKLESGAGIEDAAKELAALREEAARLKTELAGKPGVGPPGGGPLGVGGPGGAGAGGGYLAESRESPVAMIRGTVEEYNARIQMEGKDRAQDLALKQIEEVKRAARIAEKQLAEAAEANRHLSTLALNRPKLVGATP